MYSAAAAAADLWWCRSHRAFCSRTGLCIRSPACRRLRAASPLTGSTWSAAAASPHALARREQLQPTRQSFVADFDPRCATHDEYFRSLSSSKIRPESHSVATRKIWWSSTVRFSSYASGQTDRQTDILITILRTPPGSELISMSREYYATTTTSMIQLWVV